MSPQDKLQFIISACQKANPSIGALPNFPYNSDVEKAIIELEKIAGKTLWNPVLEETAAMYIGAYRQQQQSDYVAYLQHRWTRREVRLADLLLTIRSILKYKNLDPLRDEGVKLNFKSSTKYHPLYWEKTILTMYDLTHDDIRLQKLELWDLIFEILK